MSELVMKFNLLEPFGKAELLNFLDFLLSKQKTTPAFDFEAYKKSILQVSVWKEEEINIFEENQKLFNKWQAPKW